jgi:hypothetical protein
MTQQILIVFIAMVIGVASLAQTVPPDAIPIEPVSAILDAFDQHNVVALSEPHRNEQAHAFRLALIRHPRFSSMVDDIVWECGNARYQDAMDRFISGEEVAWNPAWQDTIGSIGGTLCDQQMYEDFLRAVRELNLRLPKETHVRVLLGDPPVDWDTVKSAEDAVKWAEQRGSHVAAVIRREVLPKGRRALMIYGWAHLMRANIRQNYEPARPSTIGMVAEDPKARIFTVWSDTTVDLSKFQSGVSSWSAPSLVILRGTQMGARDFADYWSAAGNPQARFSVRDGKRIEITKDDWRSRRMEEQFDALVYYGPPSAMTYSRLPPTKCTDAYIKTRVARMALVGQPTKPLIDYCASVTK